jgi:type I restriction enzyme, S subunit
MNKSTWPMVALGEVANPVQRPVSVEPGRSYRTLGVKWWGEGAYERQTIDGSQTAAKTLNEVRENDLIINKILVRHGSVAVVSPEVASCCGSNEFPIFEFRKDRIEPRWMHWYSKTTDLWTKCDSLSQGTSGKNRIRPEKFLTVTIPLPSLDEQKRIVARIDRLAGKISEAQTLSHGKHLELQAILKSSRRKLIGDEPKRNWVALHSVILDIENGWSPQCSNYPATNGKWGVLKVGAVSFGTFDPQQNKELPESLEPISRYEIKPGDFLMSRANTVELVGACALVDHTPPRLLLCDKIFRFRFDPKSQLNPAYLNHVLKSPALRSEIEAGATGTSPTMRNIAKAKIMNLRIPLPSIENQNQIVSVLDRLQMQMNELSTLYQLSSVELEALLPSILDRAFKGEL